jgi:hypothetical protein
LSWDGDDEDRWRLVILEDAGELIATDARAFTHPVRLRASARPAAAGR